MRNVIVIMIVVVLSAMFCNVLRRPQTVDVDMKTEIRRRFEVLKSCTSYKSPSLASRIRDIEIRFNSDETYTFDKRIVHLCIKSGSANAIFHTLLHELAHICNRTWGHDRNFINMFDFWLSTAIECGVYKKMTEDEIVCNVHTHK